MTIFPELVTTTESKNCPNILFLISSSIIPE